MSEASSEPEPAPGAVAAGQAPRRSAVAVVAVVALITAGLVGFLVGRAGGDGGGEREDAARAAGAFGEAILTYDYRRLDDLERRVLALSAGNFREQYEQGFEGLGQLITAARSTSKASVTDVYLGEIEDDTASAVVVVSAEATGAAGNRRLADSYLRLQLVKAAGRWKVDGVVNLNFAQPEAGVPPVPSTTSTTTP